MKRTGILITNLGTPDEATPSALRRYLAEFLWDRRVVDLPRWKWWLILHGIILRTRPAKVAKIYKKVWSSEGGPLLVISKQQQVALQKKLQEQFGVDVIVELGMRYGNPSISSALESLRAERVERIIVLPLFPQYSAATTGSTFDAVSDTIRGWRSIPELTFINEYHTHPKYIEALAKSIIEHRKFHDNISAGERLLFSYHGLPQSYHDAGDPYKSQCIATTNAVVKYLGLDESQFMIVFQSRFGKEEWLKPYIEETLRTLPKNGVKKIDLVCPGFSADCVETLEEIALQDRDMFVASGGSEYNYIPALNDNSAHIDTLSEILLERV